MVETERQLLQISTKMAVTSLESLKAVIQTLLENRHRIEHGEQSLKKLNIQGRQLEHVEIPGEDIKAFRRELNKYSVDFTVLKDKQTGEYNVYFKAQDVDRVYAGLEKCVKEAAQDLGRERDAKPLDETIENAKRSAEERAQARAAEEKDRTAHGRADKKETQPL